MNFDYIRLFLALIVALAHLGVHFLSATEAVYAFFCISGFLITKSYVNIDDSGKYFSHRLARIYPPIIALVLFMGVCGAFQGKSTFYFISLQNLLLFQDLSSFADSKIYNNGVFWITPDWVTEPYNSSNVKISLNDRESYFYGGTCPKYTIKVDKDMDEGVDLDVHFTTSNIKYANHKINNISKIKIFNSSGQVVEELNQTEPEFTFDMTNFKSGIYFYVDPVNQISKKLIKK